MSSRTSGVAVAVSAAVGGRPDCPSPGGRRRPRPAGAGNRAGSRVPIRKRSAPRPRQARHRQRLQQAHERRSREPLRRDVLIDALCTSALAGTPATEAEGAPQQPSRPGAEHASSCPPLRSEPCVGIQPARERALLRSRCRLRDGRTHQFRSKIEDKRRQRTAGSRSAGRVTRGAAASAARDLAFAARPRACDS